MTTEKKVKDKRIGKLWEPVEASPEEIARACMEGPPKERWDYLEKGEKSTNKDRQELQIGI